MTINDTIVKGDPSLGFAVLPDWHLDGCWDWIRLNFRIVIPRETKWMPLNPPPVYPLPICLHTAVLMTLIERWVFAQEPGGPVSLVWVPEKLIPIVGTLKNKKRKQLYGNLLPWFQIVPENHPVGARCVYMLDFKLVPDGAWVLWAWRMRKHEIEAGKENIDIGGPTGELLSHSDCWLQSHRAEYTERIQTTPLTTWPQQRKAAKRGKKEKKKKAASIISGSSPIPSWNRSQNTNPSPDATYAPQCDSWFPTTGFMISIILSATILDSLGQSNNHSTFGIRDPDSGSLHTGCRQKEAISGTSARRGRKSSVLLHQSHVSIGDPEPIWLLFFWGRYRI